MKKFLKITAAILILLLLFFVGTFKYRQYKANRILVPVNATTLIKINVDELYKSIGLNMISNLGYYLKSGEKKSDSVASTKFDTGLEIPAAVYFYCIEGQAKTAFFSRLELKDANGFKNFVKQQLHLNLQPGKVKGFNLARSSRGNFTLLFNESTVAIALSAQIEDFESILNDILKQKDFVAVADSKFKEIKKSSDHIAFIDNDNTGFINFNNGEISFNQEFKTYKIIPLNKLSHRNFNPESTITMWLNANFAKAANKHHKIGVITFEQDSITKYFNGSIDFEWVNSIQQTDSVVTYEYNDDFEKVEKVTLLKRNVPDFSLDIRSKATELRHYLEKQNMISVDINVVNPSVFPLYKLFVQNDQQNLIFSTRKDQKLNLNQTPTPDFFYLDVNFLKLNKQLNLPAFANYSKALKRFEVKGKSIGNSKLRIDGKLELVNKDINALYQLAKSL